MGFSEAAPEFFLKKVVIGRHKSSSVVIPAIPWAAGGGFEEMSASVYNRP